MPPQMQNSHWFGSNECFVYPYHDAKYASSSNSKSMGL
eukprot:CAMPEP_0116881976 /NCGR_PEP_ID=MMETSP0463-20121206/14067_1 /TAXON_ID=181622 /ORGANISM="Strombidinopsis sp, Strain SopsisLIS2011" /LENGTH=37 /DNA_ID= /DNA_START= /DNA_END= /DNA_ORIENTATION=